MSEPILILMVGLPRSGKSTRARKLLSEINGSAIVCPDTVRIAIHGQNFIPKTEPIVWATAHYMAEALFLAGHSAVIIDATNNTSARRAGWTKQFKGIPTYVCITTTEKDVCIQRAKDTDQDYLIPIIEKMDDEADWMGLDRDDLYLEELVGHDPVWIHKTIDEQREGSDA